MEWNFGWDTIATIVIALLGLTGFWKKTKSIIRESAQAITAISDAIADDEVSGEEAQEIADEFYDVILAARGQL